MIQKKVYRRLPENFEFPGYLTEEQKEQIVMAVKRNRPIIITGEQGKTGKTYLKNILSRAGIKAYEIFDCEIIELNEKL